MQAFRSSLVIRRAYSSAKAPQGLKPLPYKELVDMAYDLHLPERSVIGKMPYHSAEPIIFIHGILGSKRNYRNDCKKIATGLQTPVYTIDCRNHGSTEHAAPFDYDTLVNDLVHFIKKHNLGKVNLVGYSLGAKVSMLASLRHPEMFGAICAIDNSPEVQPHIKGLLKTIFKSCLQVLDQGKVRADDKLWRHKASESLKRYIPNGGIRNYILSNIIHNPRLLEYKSPVINYEDGLLHFRNPVRHMINDALDDAADWPVKQLEHAKFLGPVHFIKGLKSDFINEKSLTAINKYFPYHSIYNINTTHFVLNERPQEYVRAVVDFFKTTRHELEKKRVQDELVASGKTLNASTEKALNN